MDINTIIDIAQKDWAPFALGVVLAHPGNIVRAAFKLAWKVPFVKAQILSDPKGTKAFAEAILAEFESDVDTAVAGGNIPPIVNSGNVPKDPAK